MIEFAGGIDGQVRSFDYETGEMKVLGIFEWGGQTQKCAHLALCILRVLYDDNRAMKLHRRFMHRSIVHLPAGQDWSCTDEEVFDVVAQIEAAAKDMEPDRSRMARELPRGGVNIAMGAAKWGSERSGFGGSAPTLEPNDPKKAKRNFHDGAPVKS